jgi:hypothetical protein
MGEFRPGRGHQTMAEKRAGKKIKRLEQRAQMAEAAKLLLEKRVRKLKKKLNKRKQKIADLEGMLGRSPPITEDMNSPSAEFGNPGGTSIASSHRSTWKQHSYLRDRYEFHLGAGEEKARARRLANEDLKQAYGKDCGYTEEQLSAILS